VIVWFSKEWKREKRRERKWKIKELEEVSKDFN